MTSRLEPCLLEADMLGSDKSGPPKHCPCFALQGLAIKKVSLETGEVEAQSSHRTEAQTQSLCRQPQGLLVGQNDKCDNPSA